MPVRVGKVTPAKPQSAARTAALRGSLARLIPVRRSLAQPLFRLFLGFLHGNLHWARLQCSCRPLPNWLDDTDLVHAAASDIHTAV
jgi:hypothetical protein